MIIARQKRKENIAEYVLYMFQVEDMMRACHCDFEIVKQQIISKYTQSPGTIKDIEYWYENIILLMKNEGVEQKGHLREVLNIIDDMHDLHLRLLRSPLHPDYKAAYQEAAPVIGQSIQKTHSEGVSNVRGEQASVWGRSVMDDFFRRTGCTHIIRAHQAVMVCFHDIFFSSPFIFFTS